MICFSFVDDTNLLNTLNPGNYDIDELIINTQQALNYWQTGMQATGGKLVPEKSYWHLIDFKCTSSGKWNYKTMDETPGTLYLSTNDQSIELKRHPVTHAERELGCKTRHDGNDISNYTWFRKKSQVWADRVRDGSLQPHEAWWALKTTIYKSIEYPLLSTCFNTKQCAGIMAPALEAALNASRIQKKFPRDVAYGSLEAQGLGLYNIHILQFIEHLHVLARHGL